MIRLVRTQSRTKAEETPIGVGIRQDKNVGGGGTATRLSDSKAENGIAGSNGLDRARDWLGYSRKGECACRT